MPHDDVIFSCPILRASEQDFPIRMTKRAHQAFTSGWYYIPFFRPHKGLVVTWDDENRTPAWDYSKSFDTNQQDLGHFPRLTVAVARDAVEDLQGFIMDYGHWPLYGDGVSWYYPFDRFNGASNPGKLILSDELLRELHPELYARYPVPKQVGMWPGDRTGQRYARDEIARKMYCGDTRAALVIQTQPLIVAAYSSDLDQVVLLRFPEPFGQRAVQKFHLRPASRLISPNGYGDGVPVSDLTPDPSRTRWTNFQPNIGEFLSTDRERLDYLHSNIEEDEWARCAELAAERMKLGSTLRDGRPLLSFLTPEFHDTCRYPYADFVPIRLE
jgi:hypothetical protein